MPPAAGGRDPDEQLLQLENEYSTLKVNWFPGHMVKATKVIREKLKQVCVCTTFPSSLSWSPHSLSSLRIHRCRGYATQPPRHTTFQP